MKRMFNILCCQKQRYSHGQMIVSGFQTPSSKEVMLEADTHVTQGITNAETTVLYDKKIHPLIKILSGLDGKCVVLVILDSDNANIIHLYTDTLSPQGNAKGATPSDIKKIAEKNIEADKNAPIFF